MSSDPVNLKIAIEQQHGGIATFVKSEHITERWEGSIVWDGIVQVFDLKGNDKSTTAYAWSSPIEGSSNRKVFAVLKVAPINSPLDAVRAALVADHKNKR